MITVALIVTIWALLEFSLWYDDKVEDREKFLIERIKERKKIEEERERFIRSLY